MNIIRYLVRPGEAYVDPLEAQPAREAPADAAWSRPDLWSPPKAHAVKIQQAREADQVSRGAARFRRTQEGLLAHQKAGVDAVLREMFGGLEAAVKARIGRLASREGGLAPEERAVWRRVEAVGADRLAALAVVVGLRAVLAGPTSVTALCQEIGRAVQLEVEIDAVRAADRAQAAAERSGEPKGVRLYQAFRKTAKQGETARAWQRFCWRAGLPRMAPWDSRLRLRVGAALLDALLEAGGPVFVRRDGGTGPRSQATVALSPGAVATIREIADERALLRPVYLPMTVPPVPWRIRP